MTLVQDPDIPTKPYGFTGPEQRAGNLGWFRRPGILIDMSDNSVIRRLAKQVLPTVVEVRRALHRHPELAHQEFRSTQLIADTLVQHGLEPQLREPRSGLTVDLGSTGPLIGFRADLDALPIQEPESLPFSSEVPGVMHACGHDAHSAIALGLALTMSQLELSGRVRILFQPAEESFPGGAYEMVRDGVMEGVQSIFAFHVDPSLPPGKVGIRSGPITSSADRFLVRLEGPGGHTARPHQTVDLLHAAGMLLTQLPAFVNRKVDALVPTTLVFGRISGGTADNVIPTSVEMSGTVRTADRSLWDRLSRSIERLIHDIVAPTGAQAIVRYSRGIPPVVNNSNIVEQLRISLSSVLGSSAVTNTGTSMGAEDFARYLDLVPGALVRLGVGVGEEPADLHSAAFEMDESALEVGVIAASAAALGLLQADSRTGIEDYSTTPSVSLS